MKGRAAIGAIFVLALVLLPGCNGRLGDDYCDHKVQMRGTLEHRTLGYTRAAIGANSKWRSWGVGNPSIPGGHCRGTAVELMHSTYNQFRWYPKPWDNVDLVNHRATMTNAVPSYVDSTYAGDYRWNNGDSDYGRVILYVGAYQVGAYQHRYYRSHNTWTCRIAGAGTDPGDLVCFNGIYY